jgi:hypothetical protein
MVVVFSILIGFIVGFIVGFFVHLQRQVKIQSQYYSTIKLVINEFTKELDRSATNKFILPRNKIDILAAKIALILIKLK